MIIESMELKNFRNYRELQLHFDAKTNIFYGDNAQGKTNILEAVYLSGTTKSHKGSRDRDMILFGEDEGHLRTFVKKGEIEYQIDIHLKKNKTKGIAINGVPIRKASELFGIANFVFFFQRAKYRNIKFISDKTVDKHYPTLHSSSYPKDFPEKKSPVIIRREISHACVCLEYKGDHRFPKELPSQ